MKVAMTLTEAARAASVTPNAIRTAVRDGRLESARVGHTVVVTVAQLERFLAAQVQRPAAPAGAA
jgi:excisionase family DNA binding protein